MQAVVVALDQLAGRLLGCCGAEHVQTPAFDRLAADGLLFPLCFADDLADNATDHAWWTGTRQLFRQGTGLQPAVRLAPALSSRGVKLHLLCDPASRVPFPDDSLWTRGNPEQAEQHDPAATTPAQRLAAQVQAAVSLLSTAEPAERESSRLIWIQNAGCRLPAPVTNPDQGSDRTAPQHSVAELQAEVTALDRALLPLVEWLTAEGASQQKDPPLLIVMAARGVPIPLAMTGAEHTSSRPLGSDVVQTPLFLLVPGRWQNCRCLEFQQPMDLLPTLLEWFGVPCDFSALEGRSLFEAARATELAAGEQPPARQYRQLACTGNSDLQLAGLRTSRFYFTAPVLQDSADGESPPDEVPPQSSRAGDVQLFGKPEDQWDLHDLCGEHHDLVESFEAGLQDFCTRLTRQLPAPDPADVLPVEILEHGAVTAD